MHKRHTMLPVAMVIVVALLAMIAIMQGRSNDTGLVADSRFPSHTCAVTEYCEGPTCSREGFAFIAYLDYEDGRPRLEMPRVNPTATLEQTSSGLEFETRGGEVSGILNIYNDRMFDFVGTSGESNEKVDHFGTGRCERLQTP